MPSLLAALEIRALLPYNLVLLIMSDGGGIGGKQALDFHFTLITREHLSCPGLLSSLDHFCEEIRK